MTLRVHRVAHPVIEDSLTVIRDAGSPNSAFRTHIGRIAMVLLVEATANLPTRTATVETPLTTATTAALEGQPALVPVLRAGLGFLPAAQLLLPDADVGFVGMARDEVTFTAHPYVAKLPDGVDRQAIIVLDPMLATGGSLVAALDAIVTDHPTRSAPLSVVCALAAPEGIQRLDEHATHTGLDIDLFVGAVDERLNDRAFIVPGLGDAGDRLFGTGSVVEDPT